MKVPEGWERVPLSSVAEVRSGLAKGKKDIANPVELPYIRVANVQDGHLVLDEIKQIVIDRKNIERYSLKRGDVLLTEGGDFDKLGRGDVWNGEIEPCLHQNHVFSVRSDRSRITPYFFAALAGSHYGKNYFLNCSKRSTNLASINSTQLKGFPVLLPPLPEQKKIARILSTWDRAIRATEQILENSRQQKKGLMQQLLTGKKRLPGFEGEWRKGRLSSLTAVTMGSSPKSSAYNKGGIGLPLLQGNADIKEKRSAPRFFTSQITKVCQPGDILISVRAPVGEVARSEHEACIGRGIAAIRAKNISDQEYVYQLLWNFELKWVRYSQGSTFDAINSKDLKDLALLVPSKGEQTVIAQILTSCDDSITAQENELAALKQQKKALMQQLLTGKVRVKVDGTESASSSTT